MIVTAIVLLLVGILLGFLVPPLGFVPAGVGLLLLIAYLVNVARHVPR